MTASTRWPEARAKAGMVASPHRLASEAGVALLAEGGTALDAAVAAAATLAVVYPHMNGIGGDNFWLIYEARGGTVRGLNAAGRSAAAVDLDAARRRWGHALPVRGGAAALTVPGAVSGWWEVHRLSRDLGSLISWPRLLRDAIEHATSGVPASPSQRRCTELARDLFGSDAPAEVQQTLWPLFHPAGGAPLLVQRDLARTLTSIAEGGADEFYSGALGRRLANLARELGSPLVFDDFAQHRADWVDALRIPYRQGEAVTLPPPTQGFAALAILALLEGFDVSRLDEVDLIHLTVEATKLAFEDRDRYLTDPTVVTVPVQRCLDPTRLARRRALISRRAARPASAPTVSGDTVAIVAADRAGNAVAVIQSLYHEFGSGVVAGDTGVLLQNRGAFFSLDPLHPNCLAPRKRTAHTLIPSMYLVAGRPRHVYGTMGGEGQPQTQAALVTRLVDRGFGPQSAIEAPRWLYGRTWGESSRSLRLESRFGTEVSDELRARGHDVRIVDDWNDLMGHAHVITVLEDGFAGGSDPRADGAAVGIT